MNKEIMTDYYRNNPKDILNEQLNKITFAASLQDRSNLCILRAGRT